MAVLFLLALILMITLAAFWPSASVQDGIDLSDARAQASAQQLLTFHVGAARYCENYPDACGPNVALSWASVSPFLPTAMRNRRPYTDDRFYSFSTGEPGPLGRKYVVSYYSGAGYPATPPAQLRAGVTSAMASTFDAGVKANVGTYDAASLRFKPFTYKLTATVPGSAPEYGVSGANVDISPSMAGLPVFDGGPMMVTRMR